MQEGYAVSDFNFIKKGPADHQRSAGISDRKMSRIVTARKVGMMTVQGVNNRELLGDKYKGSEWYDVSDEIINDGTIKGSDINLVGLNLDMKL